MRKENELEKAARKHRKKQKYPMSIFPDYKKGAEEFNKNSTPINQDALSSADASSGMAEGIRKNKKKGINEEMNDDFLNWEMAEPQCTGYDCDDNIEYVYGDDENRVWIEQDGRKYKVFVNQVDEKPTATFTSLNKAKAFGEKYWQDNYGYVNESLNESINEKFSNGTLADFSPRSLMDNVKNRLEALHTIRTNGNMTYIISIHPHEWFAKLSPDTEYDVFIVAEDENGSQERISNNYDFDKLLDYEVVEELNKWKQDVLSSGMNEDWDTSVGPTYDCCGITIDFNKLNKQIGKNYQTLYDNNDEIMGGHDEMLSGSDLAYTFDCYMKEMPEFKNLVWAFSNFIQDFISSDREAAAFLFTVDELYPDIWDAIDKCGINESLNEFYDKGWKETGRGWSSDTYKIAEKVYEFLKDNDIWVDIYDYDPDSGEFSLEINGDWKHEHLRAEWLIEENLKEVDGFRIEKIGSYSLEDSNDDSYRGVHQYRIINIEEENERKKEMQERKKQFEDSLVKKVVNGKERYVSPDGKMFTKGYFTDSPDEVIWFEVNESINEDAVNRVSESYSHEERYRGCKILSDFNGEGPYTVVCLRKEYECPTLEEAKKKIDELLDGNKKNESLNENCNSYSYKGKTIIDAGGYWFVKGYEEKFPTSDEAEEFIDDKKKDEGVNINIRESLNKMDAESDNTYDLLNLYESKNLSRKQKKDIARMIYENYSLERIYNYLYEATEESEDELPVEDRVKELTNDFKNTNGSYVFEDGQDANKAVSILKSRGYEASQKRTQDGKYRVTANKK